MIFCRFPFEILESLLFLISSMFAYGIYIFYLAEFVQDNFVSFPRLWPFVLIEKFDEMENFKETYEKNMFSYFEKHFIL